MTSRPPGLSKHEAIRDSLRQMVLAMTPGTALPAERELAERWGVARMTVRQAIAALAREGLIRSVQGRGNLRAAEHVQLRVRLGSFADALREQHLDPVTRLLEWTREPEPLAAVAAFLELGDEPAWRLRRLRLGNDVPLALERTWLPVALLPDLTQEQLRGSLYGLLEERSLRPDEGEESVVADLPDAEEARLLDISPTRPVVRLTRRGRAGGRPVEYAEAVLPADRYELWFPLERTAERPAGPPQRAV
ncbi:GntR family transcriptional regulator [Desertihabitans aurantiacus]|uniref:GntR family transcriptional regulator n=1 Tax=Desertihabitans aurantiacus TaxID=2282477 RepID=UPI0018E4E6DB|nr:GntR family transcriptional regulator [Desertihabitans aurantiacus]